MKLSDQIREKLEQRREYSASRPCANEELVVKLVDGYIKIQAEVEAASIKSWTYKRKNIQAHIDVALADLMKELGVESE